MAQYIWTEPVNWRRCADALLRPRVKPLCVCACGSGFAYIVKTEVPKSKIKPEITYIVRQANGPHEKNCLANILKENLKMQNVC